MTNISEKDRSLISRLSDIILQNLENENFGVNELVSRSGMTHYVLIHRLQSATGKTISQFIRETRLKKALELIQNEDLTAAEVAFKTGFGSATYFNTCFNEFYGYPPGAVIKGEININNISPEAASSNETIKRSVTWKKVIYILAGILIVLLSVYSGKFIIFKNIRPGSFLSQNKDEISVAVLPFKNIGNNDEDQYFIDGIIDEIQSKLSGISNLRIISRASMEQFRNSPETASRIGKLLNVDYIIDGSCQKFGSVFRIRVQLVDTFNDRQIWADKFDDSIDETKDIFKIQNSIAQSIAEKIRAKMTPEEKLRMEKISTLNLNAYDFYLRGRDEAARLGNYEFNPEIIGRAEALFRKAIATDPSFAQAYIGLAGIFWKRWYLDYSTLKMINPDQYVDSMMILANIALNYDAWNEEAYIIRGSYYSVKGTPSQAVEEYDKALKFNPNNANAYFMKGCLLEEIDIVSSLENFYHASLLSHGTELVIALTRIAYNYYNSGYPDKGDQYLKEARKLESDSVPYYHRTFKMLADTKGEYENAADYSEKRVQKDSTNIILLRDLGYYYCLAGDYRNSLKYYKKYISLYNTNIRQYPFLNRFTYIGFIMKENGHRKEAEFYYNKQLEVYTSRLKSILPTERIYWTYPIAGIYATLGNKEKALEYLRMFNQNPSYTLTWVTLINNDPQFSSIRDDQEFMAIKRDIESKYQAEHEKVGKWIEKRGEK